MKFMDEVETNLGSGVAVARTAEGGLLVAVPKDKVKGKVCQGPCLNVMMRWCEIRVIWCEGKGCEGCESVERCNDTR